MRAFHAVGLAAGGSDNGGPGSSSDGRSHFAAFVLDPDGKHRGVWHRPVRRSAESVDIVRLAWPRATEACLALATCGDSCRLNPNEQSGWHRPACWLNRFEQPTAVIDAASIASGVSWGTIFAGAAGAGGGAMLERALGIDRAQGRVAGPACQADKPPARLFPNSFDGTQQWTCETPMPRFFRGWTDSLRRRCNAAPASSGLSRRPWRPDWTRRMPRRYWRRAITACRCSGSTLLKSRRGWRRDQTPACEHLRPGAIGSLAALGADTRTAAAALLATCESLARHTRREPHC